MSLTPWSVDYLLGIIQLTLNYTDGIILIDVLLIPYQVFPFVKPKSITVTHKNRFHFKNLRFHIKNIFNLNFKFYGFSI